MIMSPTIPIVMLPSPSAVGGLGLSGRGGHQKQKHDKR